MDDLFSYPSDHVHGGSRPAIDTTRRRSKTASSFRAVWDPVAASPFGEVPELYRRVSSGAPAHIRTGIDVAQVAVMSPPRALDFGEIVQPVVGVTTAVRQRVQPRAAVKHVERESAWERIATRGLELLPLALAGGLISSLVWGAYFLPVPLVIMLLGFDFYWAWRSLNMGIHTIRGYRALKATAHVDWRRRFDAERGGLDGNVVEWDAVHHLIIIPTYKESVDKLRATLGKLAESEVAHEKLLVVVAMEEADAGAPERFEILRREFGHSFLAMIGTHHPSNIPGEVRGKSSNEAWAARDAKRLFCDEMGFELDHMTVTSCDADTLFHPRYFSALTYYFAVSPRRHRLFWQGPIFYYNNVWDVPAPLRIQNSLGGINHLAKLMRKYTVLFPQSTYSLSMRMCHDVGYWDVDVVPEDWHMFLKCFFALNGEPDVQPILLPVGNDGVRAISYRRTFWEHYQQARRHAWGCTDIPYAIKQFVRHPEIPFLTRLRRTYSLTENHVLWSAQWFLITGVAANMSAGGWGGFIGLHPFAQHNIPHWFITASHYILMPCMIPLVMMIILDMMMRPARPKRWKVWLYPIQFAQWLLMAPITLFFTSLPALDAQIRLALGRRLEYKVTEKA